MQQNAPPTLTPESFFFFGLLCVAETGAISHMHVRRHRSRAAGSTRTAQIPAFRCCTTRPTTAQRTMSKTAVGTCVEEPIGSSCVVCPASKRPAITTSGTQIPLSMAIHTERLTKLSDVDSRDEGTVKPHPFENCADSGAPPRAPLYVVWLHLLT